MKLKVITQIPRRLGIKIPENFLKEEVIRFLIEPTSERIAEIPIVLNNIPQKKSRILDVGCRYSLLPIQLASLGHETYGIDINTYHRNHPNFQFHLGDIINSPYKNNFFDCVISLSTIEHIGLNFYGDDKDVKGDEAAIKEINRVLKPKGKYIMTAPFGKPKDSAWYRVYDKERIYKLLRDFSVARIQIYREIKGNWIPTTIKDGEKIDCSRKVSAMFYVSAIKK